MCTIKVPVYVPVTWEGGKMMTEQYSNYFIWREGDIRKVTGSNCVSAGSGFGSRLQTS